MNADRLSKHRFPLHQPLAVAGILDPYTLAYPDKMKTKVEINLKDGKTLRREQEDYHGFFTRPFTWEDTIQKFRRLADGVVDQKKQDELIAVVHDLDHSADMSLFFIVWRSSQQMLTKAKVVYCSLCQICNCIGCIVTLTPSYSFIDG
jgi:inosine-uridine nucleoside N-ribohydrolase